jgi:hypothetical protein
MAAAMFASPAMARIDDNAPQKNPTKTKGCVRGAHQTRFITADRALAPDHSYIRVTWQPRFCVNSGEWVTSNAPSVSLLGPGTINGLSLDLDAARSYANGVEYRGHVRQCVPLSVSKGPAGTSGSGCYTVGNVTFNATVVGDKVAYSWKISTARTPKLDGLIRKLKWTSKIA